MKTIKIILAWMVLTLFAGHITVYAQKEIKIGNQIWMSENVELTHFRNGDSIPEAKSAAEWNDAAKQGKPAWCFYKNESANGSKYGLLYNWYAVNDPRQICPEGWHVATDKDWNTLITYVGGTAVGAIKLKATEWLSIGEGTNSSGFSALPAGLRFNGGEFLYFGKNGYWWTSTSSDKNSAISIQMSSTDTFILSKIFNKKQGLSVRCVKD